jgi:hypothetical protein
MGQNRDMNDNASDQVLHVGRRYDCNLGGGVLHYHQSVMI